MKNTKVVKVGTRGTVTIPSELRSKYFGPGDWVRVTKKDGKLVISPITFV